MILDTSKLSCEGLTQTDVRKAEIDDEEICKIFGAPKCDGKKQMYKFSRMKAQYVDRFLDVYRRCYQRFEVCIGEIDKFYANAFALRISGSQINWKSFVVKNEKGEKPKEKADVQSSTIGALDKQEYDLSEKALCQVISDLQTELSIVVERWQDATAKCKESKKYWKKFSHEMAYAEGQMQDAKDRMEKASSAIDNRSMENAMSFLSSNIKSKEDELLKANEAYKALEQRAQKEEETKKYLHQKVEKLHSISASLKRLSNLQVGFPYVEQPSSALDAFVELKTCSYCTFDFDPSSVCAVISHCLHAFHYLCTYICFAKDLKCPECLTDIPNTWLKSLGIRNPTLTFSAAELSHGCPNSELPESHAVDLSASTEGKTSHIKAMSQKFAVGKFQLSKMDMPIPDNKKDDGFDHNASITLVEGHKDIIILDESKDEDKSVNNQQELPAGEEMMELERDMPSTPIKGSKSIDLMLDKLTVAISDATHEGKSISNKEDELARGTSLQKENTFTKDKSPSRSVDKRKRKFQNDEQSLSSVGESPEKPVISNKGNSKSNKRFIGNLKCNSVGKKLLILEINDLLVKVFNKDTPVPEMKSGVEIVALKKELVAVRPGAVTFLNFCLKHFEVAIWSTFGNPNVYLGSFMPSSMHEKFLFIWSRTEARKITLKSLGESVFLKDLSKVWKKYTEFSLRTTLLIDPLRFTNFLNMYG